MTTYAPGSTTAVPIVFREYEGGPYTDPPDPRFDVYDPLGVLLDSDVPATLVISPGRYEGQWPIPGGSDPGIYVMRFKATIDGEEAEQDCTFTVSLVPTTTGPCGWEDAWDDACCDLPDGTDDALVESWRNVAATILWAASGRRYGLCEVTIRPCLRRCGGGSGNWWVPYKDGDGNWLNYNACGCADDCSCTELCIIDLPGPVAGITQVLVDGVELEEENYRLDQVGTAWQLVRVHGGCWEPCQDMTASCEEENTLCVTYLQGVALDALAIAAVSELTCQLVRACIPGCKCDLPKNVQSVVRRGVSITYDNSIAWIKSLPMVASWLTLVNPSELSSASSVWSPDIPSTRVVPTDFVS